MPDGSAQNCCPIRLLVLLRRWEIQSGGLCMENDFMDVAGSFKEENIIIIYAYFSSAGFNGIDLMRFVGLERIAFIAFNRHSLILLSLLQGLSFNTKSIASTRY